MWQEAIKAIQNSDDEWIDLHQKDFKKYFKDQNLEPQGKLKETALLEHYSSRLFKMFLPNALDGLELPIYTGSCWIENASRLDSNWGWLLAIGAGGAYFADYLLPEISEKFFLPKEALVAGSGKPNGKAVDLKNGFTQLSGSWSYCSGAEQASLFTAVVNTKEGNSAVILPVNEVQIKRDWNAIGLSLTCSHTIKTKDVEVPNKYLFDLTSSPRKSNYPLSTYPFMLFAQACFVPVLIGISLSFLKEVENLLKQKEKMWKTYQPERFKSVHSRIETFFRQIQERRKNFYELLDESWQKHISGQDCNEKELSDKSFEIGTLCYNSSSEILPVLGMDVISKAHPVQILWQDIQAVRQHAAFQNYM